MKFLQHTYSILLALLIFCGCVSSQEIAPKEVQTAFKKKYPGENDPDWHKDSNGNFESHFKIKGKSLRADFSPDGQWIETERSIKKDELPKAVRNTIEKEYKALKIAEIEEVDHHSKGRFYDIEFKRKGENKDVEINENGMIIN